MKGFDKKFADQYIDEQLKQEKKVSEEVFYQNMDIYQKIIFDMKRKPKYEHTEFVKFFLKCNWFERVMLIIAQGLACCLPFMMLAALGSSKWGVISGMSWVAVAVSLGLMSISRRIRTGEKISISFIPKLNTNR